MRTVIRPLVPRMEYGLRLLIKRIPYSFVLFTLAIFSVIQTEAQSVSCHARLNISINSGAKTTLKVRDLTPRNTPEALMHVVAEMDDRSDLEFTCADIGKELMITLRDTISSQRCMVVLNVEDKARLHLSCNDMSIYCIDEMPSARSVIDILSCHDKDDLIFLQPQDIRRVAIVDASDTVEVITRRYKVQTQNGEVDSCEGLIYVRDFDISSIEFPMDTEIGCSADPSDVSIAGDINVSRERLAFCNIGVTSRILDTTFCLSRTKYIKEWIVQKWPSGVEIRDTQYIQANDSLIIDIPEPLEVIEMNCQKGIVLDTLELMSICEGQIRGVLDPQAFSHQIEVVGEGFFSIGDTVYVDEGSYQVVYEVLSGLCISSIESDTIEVVVGPITTQPILDCDDIVDLSIALKDGESTWIKLDSIFQDLSVTSCSNYTFVGRKTQEICDMDTEDFTPSLELCPGELLSGQTPGTISIELAARDNSENLSNICIVNIDVQEKVPPVITPLINPNITLDQDGMMYELDTFDLIASLFDNSGCISSLTMTGSGIGVTTGSGIPFLYDGNFITFDCSNAGTYDVAIFATDCDNNRDTAVTRLTVDEEGLCSLNTLTGTISSASEQIPMADIEVLFDDNKSSHSIMTDEKGQFYLGSNEFAQMNSISIEHNDHWTKGLSVIDLKLIQDYILGRMEFEPWQIASADMDDSGSVSALDLIQIQKIILGYEYHLATSQMPWLFSATEDASYADYFKLTLDNDITDLSITSTKRGDVNGDAMSTAQARSTTQVIYSSQPITEYITHFTINVEALKDLSALQFRLTVDHGQIGNLRGPENMVWQNDQNIDLLYYTNADEVSNLDYNHFIEFDVYSTSFNRPAIELHEAFSNISYDYYNRMSTIALKSDHQENVIDENGINFIAQPNPTFGTSLISIVESNVNHGNISVDLYDLQGQLILSKKWDDTDLSSVFPLEIPELPHFGLYIAQIRINQTSQQLYIMKK